jgi:CubicO group peptidase (beta-lactamase class C family)
MYVCLSYSFFKGIMKHIFFLLAIACCFSCMGQTSPSSTIRDAVDLFEQTAVQYMHQDQISGLSVVVTHKGSVVYMNGLGNKSLDCSDPITKDTRFRIASVSKMLVAIAVLQLSEEGVIELDVPVVDYLGWFRLNDPEGRWKKITVRHLLNHTAGLPRGEGIDPWGRPEAMFAGNIFSSEDVIPYALDQGQVADPGELIKYSNFGFWLLSQLVVEYGGSDGSTRDEKYVNYIEDKIFRRLNFGQSGYVINDSDACSFASPYGLINDFKGQREAVPFIYNPGFVTGAWGAYSTANDLSKFLIWLAKALTGDSAPLLKPCSFAKMIASPVKDSHSNSSYALGISMMELSGRRIVGHSGLFNGYQSQVAVDMDSGTGVALLLNATGVVSGKYMDLLFSTVGNASELLPPKISLLPQNVLQPFKPQDDSPWKKIIGLYQHSACKIVISENSEGCLIADSLYKLYLLRQTPTELEFLIGWDAPFLGYIGERVIFYCHPNGEAEFLEIANTFRAYRI